MEDWQSNLSTTPSNSLLVSTANGKLIRLYCPIPAVCNAPVAGIQKGESVRIERIYTNEEIDLLYEIEGLSLPHTYFIIV